jgi:hypothetical protein
MLSPSRIEGGTFSARQRFQTSFLFIKSLALFCKALALLDGLEKA